MFDTIILHATPSMLISLPTKGELERNRARLKKQRQYKTLLVTHAYDGGITVCISIPQLLFGSSRHEYLPIHADTLYSKIYDLFLELGISVVDYNALLVNRLDICRNISTPRPAADHVNQAARYLPKRTHVGHYASESAIVRWSIKRSLSVYDKGKKERRRDIKNLVRIEMQLKGTRMVQAYTGVRCFSDVLEFSWQRAYSILHSQLALVVGESCTSEAPDAAELWSIAKAARNRDTAPFFIALYLATITEISPADLYVIREQIRQHGNARDFSRLKKTLLAPVSVARMDTVFRREVLDRLLDPPPEAA